MTPSAAAVTIVQPYVPTYREPLFKQVVTKLAQRDIRCRVAAPPPAGDQALRGDAVTQRPEWLTPLVMRNLRVRGHWLRYYDSRKLWRGTDALVYELASGCLDTSLALVRKGGRAVGVWGHVISYDTATHPLDTKIEAWQMRRSDHVFAYTARGGDAAATYTNLDKISVLGNTVDTSAVARAAHELSEDAVVAFRAEVGADDRQLLAYVGGLDTTKRIDFLAAALEHLHKVDRRALLLVCGEGADKHLLRPAEQRGQVKFLGFADARQKALLGATCELMLMPGRVGLVAVESFVLGLPIVTVPGPLQAPEFEYLTAGRDSLAVQDSPAAYADAVAELLAHRFRLAEMRAAALAKSGWPSLDDMSDRYVSGVLQMLAGR